jgi:flagellin-like protein
MKRRNENKMKIGRFKVSKRAVSPVIATLLMIAIAVAASIIVYVWSIGLLGGLMGSGGSQTKEQLIMEAYNWQTSTTITFTLRNVGSAPVTVAAVYLGGTALNTALNSAVGIGTAQGFSLSPTASLYTAGAAYTLKVVSTTGGVFAFSVIDGSSG